MSKDPPTRVALGLPGQGHSAPAAHPAQRPAPPLGRLWTSSEAHHRLPSRAPGPRTQKLPVTTPGDSCALWSSASASEYASAWDRTLSRGVENPGGDAPPNYDQCTKCTFWGATEYAYERPGPIPRALHWVTHVAFQTSGRRGPFQTPFIDRGVQWLLLPVGGSKAGVTTGGASPGPRPFSSG